MRNKKWLKLGAAGILSFALLTACGGNGDDGQTDSSDSGDTGATEAVASDAEEIYNNNCMSCHGDNLQGGMGPALDTIGSSMSKEEIVDVITNGVGSMPAQTQVSSSDADTLAEWLASKK